MREKNKRVSPIVWVLYGVMIILTFVLLFISKMKYQIENPIEQQYESTISFLDGWTDEEGNAVDLLNLSQEDYIKAGKEYFVFHSLPDDLKEGYTLNIYEKNIYYQVYVNDILLYDVYNPKRKDVENSFGRSYSMIPIEKDMAGKTLKMQMIPVYDGKSASFLDITLGLPQGHLLHFAREKIISIIICMLFFFVSILLILIDIPINMQNEKSHELLALGLFSFSVGMWGLMSTHVFEYFTGDGRTVQIAACLFLSLITVPLLIYYKNSMGFFHSIELSLYTIVSFIEFMVVWTLELTDTADVQSTLIFTHIMLGIGIILFVSLPFRKYKLNKENTDFKIYHRFRITGLIALIIGTGIEFVRYYLGTVLDNAIFVRFGLLIFIMCYGTASLEKTIRAVKFGAKAEFIRKLAYQDGLTNLSNRTAFNERLEQFQAKQKNAAIIMFDVNDLKKVNDNLGHQYGDEMLVESAKLISGAFHPIDGECYRIGGDEFVVLLGKENSLNHVTAGLQAFEQSLAAYNNQDNLKYEIRIAFGYAILDEEKCDINQLYEIADQRMYECKKKMKEKGKLNYR